MGNPAVHREALTGHNHVPEPSHSRPVGLLKDGGYGAGQLVVVWTSVDGITSNAS
jgi:hypothetical protein